jgi:hypothetical protein
MGKAGVRGCPILLRYAGGARPNELSPVVDEAYGFLDAAR